MDFGLLAQDVRQWRKDKYNRFSPFIQEKDKISEILSVKQRERDNEIRKSNWEAKQECKERVTLERQQEKEFWEEKFRDDLHVAEQKLEMEMATKTTHGKLPKLRITLEGHFIRLGLI